MGEDVDAYGDTGGGVRQFLGATDAPTGGNLDQIRQDRPWTQSQMLEPNADANRGPGSTLPDPDADRGPGTQAWMGPEPETLPAHVAGD